MDLSSLIPHFCLGCGRPIKKGFLCSNCWQRLSFYDNHQGKCLYCQKPSVDNLTHHFCHAKLALEGGLVLYNYDPVVGRIIRYLKYNLLEKGEKIFRYLIELWWQNNSSPLIKYWQENDFCLQPVPLSSSRRLWRGFNQAEVLAQLLAQKLKLPLVNYFQRTKTTLPRLRLSLSERKKAVQNSYQATRPSLEGKNLLLIDDVLTTGSTFRELAKVAKRRKASQVWYLALSSKPRRRG